MKTTQRKWWLAILLSLPFPGLGQIYNGQFKKGLQYYGLFIFGVFLATLFICGGIAIAPMNLWLALFCVLAVYLYILWDAFKTAKKSEENFQRKSYNHWYIYLAAIIITKFVSDPLMTRFLNTYTIKSFHIPSTTMEDTLLSGDYMLASMSDYGIRIPFTQKRVITDHQPKQGDLVIFKFPQDPRREFIKRCIATEGQEVKIKDKKVFVDGKHYENSHGVKNMDSGTHSPTVSPRDNFGPYTVPEGHFFVLGDNRDNSYDSRFWGAVPVENLLGRAIQIYFSRDENSGGNRWSRIGKTLN